MGSPLYIDGLVCNDFSPQARLAAALQKKLASLGKPDEDPEDRKWNKAVETSVTKTLSTIKTKADMKKKLDSSRAQVEATGSYQKVKTDPKLKNMSLDQLRSLGRDGNAMVQEYVDNQDKLAAYQRVGQSMMSKLK